MGCFSRNELNSFSFIRWRSADTVLLADAHDSGVCAGTVQDFPNQYRKDSRFYIPKIVMGAEISIYANLDTPATDSDTGDWVLKMVDKQGNLNATSFTLNLDDFSGDKRWYFTFTPNAANFVDNQLYRFVIYNDTEANDPVRYVSNWIQAKPASEAENYAYLSYRNPSSIFNFNYTDLTSFRNKIFVDLNMVDQQPEIELSQYPEISTGEVRNSKTYSKEVITLESQQFDFESHQAMLALSAHSGDGAILLNTNEISIKEAYAVEANRNSLLQNGTIKVYNQAVSTVNLVGFD